MTDTLANDDFLIRDIRWIAQHLAEGNAKTLYKAIAEIERLRRAIPSPDVAMEALREMAKQKLLVELDPEELENADVFGGYDEMVKTARAAALASRPAMAESRERLGEAIYMAMYGDQGAIWAANEDSAQSIPSHLAPSPLPWEE